MLFKSSGVISPLNEWTNVLSHYNPFWFKSTKNKELALFLQVYKSEMLIEGGSKE